MFNEFYDCLSKLNIDCIVIDDPDINPIEVTLLVENRKSFLAKAGAGQLPLSFTENGIIRRVNVITLKGIGAKNLKEQWIGRAQNRVPYVYELSDSDKAEYYLLYVFSYGKAPCWERQNILAFLYDYFTVTDEHELVTLLAGQINNRQIKGTLALAWRLPYYVTQDVHGFYKYVLLLFKVFNKIATKVPFMLLTVKSFFHKRFRNEKFLSMLKKSEAIKGQITVLTNRQGSTSSVLVKESYQGHTSFIKGSDMDVYNSFANEFAAQKKMLDAGGVSTCLQMTQWDSEAGWIKYPYLKHNVLERMVEEKGKLNDHECEILGDFLIETIISLRNNNIIHNDFRPGNIMAKLDENGNAREFILIDFGCACVDDRFPWNKESWWGRYMAKHVCGAYRYSRIIVDDAASAELIYRFAGGSSKTVLETLHNEVGKKYFVSE